MILTKKLDLLYKLILLLKNNKIYYRNDYIKNKKYPI